MDLHGGNIYKIFRESNKREILDYSSNINPFGLPDSLKKGIVENLHILERYPDPDYIELREKIAKTNKLHLNNIILGNGATEIIFLFMKVLKLQKVLIVSPTFSEYERAVRSVFDDKKKQSDSISENQNLQIDYFELEELSDFVLNENKLISQLDNEYDLLIICNPNNPTGKMIELEKLEKILRKCNEKNTKMFVDEAFIEFVENWEKKSIINTKEKKGNLFVIRAFTKFFAVPGLRLGYGICFDENLFEKMNEKKEPWSVNNIADLAGKIVMDDKEYIEKTEKWIKEEKKYMYDEISRIEGVKTYRTEVNFILVKISDTLISQGLNVKKLREKMMEKGILIRDASNFKYLDESYFRLAVKSRTDNDKVIEKLKECLK